MNKVYACADLHGMYNLWGKIKDFLDDSDKLFFLGDAIDRGPNGIKIMKEMLVDSRVVYLLGNHEDMMLDGLQSLINGFLPYSSWDYNGNETTLKELHEESSDFHQWLYTQVKQMAKDAYYLNKNGETIHLTHAGSTPPVTPIQKAIYGKNSDFYWDRDHFTDTWPQGYEDRYEVHGHTPVSILKTHFLNLPADETPQIVKYAEGHKIDIDCESCWSGITVLLDLDTLKPIYLS